MKSGFLAGVAIAGALTFVSPAHAGEIAGSIYRCTVGEVLHYTSKPIAGADCRVVSYHRGPQPAAYAAPATFAGYSCTQGCSGHLAGYEWAQRRGITTAVQCGGNSQSFIQGCTAWVEEVSGRQYRRGSN